MDIGDLARQSFLLVEASWPLGDVAQLVVELAPSHIVVHRADEAGEAYFLVTAEELRTASTSERRTIGSADFLEQRRVPVVDASGDPLAAPGRCLIAGDEGRIIGFHDVDYSERDERLYRSAMRDGAPTPVTRGEPRHDGGGDAAPALVSRSLEAEFPSEVGLEQAASLLVSITAAPADTAAKAFVVPIGTTIDILVQARRGFTVEGEDRRSVAVGSEDTLPLEFRLRATALGQGEIRVLAFRDGQALVSVTLKPVVEEAAESAVGAVHRGTLAPAHARGPDLMLLIEDATDHGKPAFTFRLIAPYLDPAHNLTRFGPVVLEYNPLDYFRDFFTGIEALPRACAADRAIAEEQLKAKGATLFERLVPKELGELLWSLRGKDLVIQIQSNEPWIPWELCRLVGTENGDICEGPFLCEAFVVARWQPGVAFKSLLQFSNIALVVPADSGLPLAVVERRWLLGLAGQTRQVKEVAARFLELHGAFKAGTYDVWHFTGHGIHPAADPNKAQILLEQGQVFTPDNLAGEARRLGKAKPLVFLNACQTGRGGMSLTSIGGWAKAFLDAGASAFIGTYWSVSDQGACTFATTVYDRLVAGEPIGKAVQAARSAIRGSGDPTWLAYTLFADPQAALA